MISTLDDQGVILFLAAGVKLWLDDLTSPSPTTRRAAWDELEKMKKEPNRPILLLICAEYGLEPTEAIPFIERSAQAAIMGSPPATKKLCKCGKPMRENNEYCSLTCRRTYKLYISKHYKKKLDSQAKGDQAA